MIRLSTVEPVTVRLARTLCYGLAASAVIMLATDPSWAVEVENLRAPIQGFKREIFGGWMMAVKIGAAAAGAIMSAFKASLAPLGLGAGLSVGVHLFDQYLGDGAAGALI